MSQAFEDRVRQLMAERGMSDDAARTTAGFETGDGGDLLVNGEPVDYAAELLDLDKLALDRGGKGEFTSP